MNAENTQQSPAAETPISDQATRKAHDFVDEAGKRASAMERELRTRTEQTRERLGEEREAAALRMEESLATVEQFIRDKPLAAAGIAFAAGLLVSRILGK